MKMKKLVSVLIALVMMACASNVPALAAANGASCAKSQAADERAYNMMLAKMAHKGGEDARYAWDDTAPAQKSKTTVPSLIEKHHDAKLKQYGADSDIHESIEITLYCKIYEEWGFASIVGYEPAYIPFDHSIDLPATVEGYPVAMIEAGAFAENKTLVEIGIPDSVYIIETAAFYHCVKLANVKIPQSLAYLGYVALSDTPWYASLTGEFVVMGDGCLIKSNNPKSAVSIPNTVKHISGGVFEEQDAIKTLIMPSTVESIGESAFHGCDNLMKISFSDKTWLIDYSAFFGCKRLMNIVLPNDLEYIANAAFSECESLRSIKVPAQVWIIEESAFEACANLETMRILSENIIIENAFLFCPKLAELYFYGNAPEQMSPNQVFYGSAQGLTLYYLESYANTWSRDGRTSWDGYPLKVFDGGSSADILRLNPQSSYHIIGGILREIKAKTKAETVISNFFNQNAGIANGKGVAVSNGSDLVGTGYKVRVISLARGNVIDELVIVVTGDVDGNCAINTLDIAELQKEMLGLKALNDPYYFAADTNDDGSINSMDIAYIQNSILTNA